MGRLRALREGDAQIDFPRWWPRMLVLSAVLVLVGVGSLVVRGLNLGIDFEGGTIFEVEAPDASVSDARSVLADFDADDARIQEVEGGVLRIQSDVDDSELAAEIGAALEAELGPIRSLEQVGPTWGEEITEKAVRALIWFFVVLAAYISIRLEWRMAVGALASILHDMVLTVGAYALFQFQVTPATVVAFLTIMGYSLYDTVVVYDKAREIEGRVGATGRYTYAELMNLAMNRVLMRSVNTTLTSTLPVLSLVVVGSLMFGATTLQEFGIALLIGMVVGAYSSVSVAVWLVVKLKERTPRYREISQKLASRGSVDEGTRVISREEVALTPAARQRLAAGRAAAPSGSRARPPGDATAGGEAETPAAPPRPAPSTAIPPRPRKKRKRPPR